MRIPACLRLLAVALAGVLLWVGCGSAEPPSTRQLDQPAAVLDATLQGVQELSDELSTELSAGQLPMEVVVGRLSRELGRFQALTELGVALSPSDDPLEPRLWARAVRRVDGELVVVNISDFEDYVPEDGSPTWFTDMEQVEGWEGSLCDEVAEVAEVRLVQSFTLPGDPARKGVLYAQLDLAPLQRLLQRVESGPEGYAWLELGGRYLVHDDWDCVYQACSSPSGLPPDLRGPRRVAGKVALSPEQSARRSELAQQCALPGSSGLFGEGPVVQEGPPLEHGPGFTLGRVFDQPPNNDDRRQDIMVVLVLCVVAALLLSFVLLVLRHRRLPDEDEDLEDETEHETINNLAGAPHPRDLVAPRVYRRVSWMFTTVFALAILGTLCLADQYPADPASDFKRTTDSYDLQEYLEEHARETLSERESLPQEVPTGIFVQSISFQSAKEVLLTGFVWQRYTEGLHDGLSQGFLMPESQATEITEISRDTVDGETRIVWSFQVLLNQEFDYTRFPFGLENIWVQLWHEDFADNVILVPDLQSYKVTRPKSLSGLRKDLQVPGWQVEETFFGYRKKTYGTSFGHRGFHDVTDFPELHLNIIVSSDIIQPLVAYILPITVIIVLLYTILLLTSPYKIQADGWGFNAMNSVTAAAGFFLVAVFSHADLRSSLSFRGINYLEYFYFVTYLALMVVVINALLVSLTNIRFLRRFNNGIPKLFFWPVSLAMLYMATVKVFW